MLLAFFGVLSGIFSLVACIPYFRDIFKGTTKPERATWFIWTVVSVITVASQIASGAKWSLIMAIAINFVVITTFILSIKYGEGGVTRLDIISLFIAGLGLVGWAITNDPLVALLFMIFVDSIAAALTFRKSYLEPETETVLTWQLYCVSNFFGFLAVGKIDLDLLLYPGYLFVANGAIVAAILAGQRRQKQTRTR